MRVSLGQAVGSRLFCAYLERSYMRTRFMDALPPKLKLQLTTLFPSFQTSNPHCAQKRASCLDGMVESASTVDDTAQERPPAVDSLRQKPLQAGLYLVGTPIGNLEDITLRALRVLREADVILAEDTRHSRKLLSWYGVQTRMLSFHEHNERERRKQILEMLRSGMKVALISDAGMPLISDPGSSLVHAAAQEKLQIIPIPGPSAVLAALVASGLQITQFLFCGFLPPKRSARLASIKDVAGIPSTLLFFVPPHSLAQILLDLGEILTSSRRCVVAREITKIHEEFFRGTLAEAAAEFSSRHAKGEVTVAVEGATICKDAVSEEEIKDQLQELMVDGCSHSTAAKILSKALKLPRNEVYSIAIRTKESAE